MKKVLSTLLAAVLSVSAIATVPSAEAEKATAAAKSGMVILGDSIATGYTKQGNVAHNYGEICGDYLGCKVSNYAVVGDTTDDMLALIDKMSAEQKKNISDAEYVVISIGGNDYLYSNIIELIFALLLGSTAPAKKIIDNAYKNFKSIISKIKTINPDAVIIVQTLYNPNHPLISSVLEKFVSMLNEMFTRYLEENPGAYYIADVHEALKGQIGFIALDTIHPNARGNVIIAKVLLKLLKELDLGKTETPVINHQGISELFGPIWSILQFVKKFA